MRWHESALAVPLARVMRYRRLFVFGLFGVCLRNVVCDSGVVGLFVVCGECVWFGVVWLWCVVCVVCVCKVFVFAGGKTCFCKSSLV